MSGASNHHVAQGAGHETTAWSSVQASVIPSSHLPPSSLEDKTVRALSHPCSTTRGRRKPDLLLKRYVRSSVPASRNTGPVRYTSLLLLISRKRPNEATVPPEESATRQLDTIIPVITDAHQGTIHTPTIGSAVLEAYLGTYADRRQTAGQNLLQPQQLLQPLPSTPPAWHRTHQQPTAI